MRPISQERFDALSAYCRDPRAEVLMKQLAWYEAADESVLGTLVVDTDGEFSGIILARDLLERFRWANGTDFFDTPDQAVQPDQDRRSCSGARTDARPAVRGLLVPVSPPGGLGPFEMKPSCGRRKELGRRAIYVTRAYPESYVH